MYVHTYTRGCIKQIFSIIDRLFWQWKKTLTAISLYDRLQFTTLTIWWRWSYCNIPFRHIRGPETSVSFCACLSALSHFCTLRQLHLCSANHRCVAFTGQRSPNLWTSNQHRAEVNTREHSPTHHYNTIGYFLSSRSISVASLRRKISPRQFSVTSFFKKPNLITLVGMRFKSMWTRRKERDGAFRAQPVNCWYLFATRVERNHGGNVLCVVRIMLCVTVWVWMCKCVCVLGSWTLHVMLRSWLFSTVSRCRLSSTQKMASGRWSRVKHNVHHKFNKSGVLSLLTPQ